MYVHNSCIVDIVCNFECLFMILADSDEKLNGFKVLYVLAIEGGAKMGGNLSFRPFLVYCKIVKLVKRFTICIYFTVKIDFLLV